jgi:hypothetical protein
MLRSPLPVAAGAVGFLFGAPVAGQYPQLTVGRGMVRAYGFGGISGSSFFTTWESRAPTRVVNGLRVRRTTTTGHS